jgi:hypothetical protein
MPLDKQNNIYSIGSFDSLPEHIYWSFNGAPYAWPDFSEPTHLNYSVGASIERKKYDFQNEFEKAVSLLIKKAGTRKLALCLSGGVDSEAIAWELKRQKANFELFFLSNWLLNEPVFENYVQPLAETLEVPLHKVILDRDYFLQEYAPRCFQRYFCHYPTYIALTYLFSQIPGDFYIVVGEGDLDKKGKCYSMLTTNPSTNLPDQSSGSFIPIMLSEIFYRLWAQEQRRTGEFYFYSSTPELMAAMWQHPLFEKRFPYYSTKNVLMSLDYKMKVRKKSTNWENNAKLERANLVRILHSQSAKDPRFKYWHRAVGAFFNIESLFVGKLQ